MQRSDDDVLYRTLMLIHRQTEANSRRNYRDMRKWKICAIYESAYMFGRWPLALFLRKKRLSSRYVPTGMKCFSQSTQKNFISVDPMRSNSDYDSRGDWCTNSRLGLEANMVYLSAWTVRTLHPISLHRNTKTTTTSTDVLKKKPAVSTKRQIVCSVGATLFLDL